MKANWHSLPSPRISVRSACGLVSLLLSPRRSAVLLTVVAAVALLLSGCASELVLTATPVPPTLSPTPRSTPLPTVPTQVPVGSKDQPYQVLVVPPAESSATGKSLNDFLQEKTGLPISVQIVSNYDDILSALCGSVPTVAWADSWTILRALARNCATPVLRIKRGDSTGVAVDLLVSTAANLKTMEGLRTSAKTRDFCRVSASDTVSWILPALLMRTTKGFEPLSDFRTLKDMPDRDQTIREVVFNRCVAAIATGTLGQYKVADVSDVTKVVTVLATSPELPYGGLLISNNFPKPLADQIVKLFTDNMDQLKDYVDGDSFLPANASDFAEIQKFAEAAGIDPALSGQAVPLPPNAGQ